MQLYRVKLNEGHTAKPDQIAGEYLGGYANIDPMLYTRSEAHKKARMFGGTIEPFGRDYTVDELKVIQIPKAQLSQDIPLESPMNKSAWWSIFITFSNDLSSGVIIFLKVVASFETSNTLYPLLTKISISSCQ